jgi:signal transduction histidine kinase
VPISSLQSVNTGGATTIIDYNLTPNKAIVADADGKKHRSTNTTLQSRFSIKYAGKGKKVFIKTWDDPDWVFVEVRDNGTGIGPDDLSHIFDKFYRVKNDSTHVIKGSGLGLYLVKYFIELHNGVITATSQLGEGTSFIIKLKNE